MPHSSSPFGGCTIKALSPFVEIPHGALFCSADSTAMDAFFDLNIPYSEASPSDKDTRINLVTTAMELGYSGIAYNRTIKGVMSDRDRCSIPLLTLSSLLKLSPSLSSSVRFHRDLLGVPRASPFRQYTRLTLVADNSSQVQALNSGNPILKTYDLVSVRPMNQTVFDQACEKLEVNIITIDFSQRLPFRLKLPMIKAAIERGVYFEITYSGLITDIQSRRQMIANAKLLVDWTRGKNLIISSAAPFLYELRGPYDVANLSSLLGLSMERAKAAVSKNCRTLITKALRKKQFHKETIKVEPISSGEQVASKSWSGELFDWDPISSGEGDLHLDDIAKAFAASSEVSKQAKPINFTSIIGSMPSHGFQVKNLISRAQATPQSPENSKNVNFVGKSIELLGSSDGNLERHNRVDLPEPGLTSVDKVTSKLQALENHHSQILYACDATRGLSDAAQTEVPMTTTEAKSNNPSQSTVDVDLIRMEIQDPQSQKPVNSFELHVSKAGIVLDSTSPVHSKGDTSTPSEGSSLPAPKEDENLRSSSIRPEVIGQDLTGEDSNDLDTKSQETSLLSINLAPDENFTEKEQFEEPEYDPVLLIDHAPSREYDAVRVEHNPSAANSGPPDVTMKDQKHGKADTESNQLTLLQSTSGSNKSKRKVPRQAMLLPFKLRLSSSPFKKKSCRKKTKIKMA